MSFNEVSGYLKKNDSILIPMGSTEQHSYALPLYTDTLIAEKICERIAVYKNWLIGPSINIGFSSGYQPFLNFTGTISYKKSTLEKVIIDYIESVCHHGFKNIYIINTHGGNNKLIRLAIKKISKKYKGYHIYLHSWWKIDKVVNYSKNVFGQSAMNHAGASETSLAVYLFPQLVNRNKFTKEYSGVKTKSGVVDSDQKCASKLNGKKIFEYIVKTTLKDIKFRTPKIMEILK